MSQHGNLQKYENPNPAQQWLLGRFLQQVVDLTGSLEVQMILDAGCAEGFVSRHLQQQWGFRARFWGIDLDTDALVRGQALTHWMQRGCASILALPFADAQFDLVLCTEVLEHLPDPILALRELRRVTRAYVLLSVPHEPWFRLLNALRGKHLHAWGNDPEHVQNWTGQQFVDFAMREFVVVKRIAAFPWTLLLCRKESDQIR